MSPVTVESFFFRPLPHRVTFIPLTNAREKNSRAFFLLWYFILTLPKVVQVFNYFVLITAAGHLLKEIIALLRQVSNLNYIVDSKRYFCHVLLGRNSYK